MILLSRRSLLAIAAVVDIALHARPLPVAAKHLASRHNLPPRHLETMLQAVPSFYEQAKQNLADPSEVAGDLAVFAIHNLEGNGSPFTELSAQLAEYHPELVPHARKAQAAIDG